MTGWQANAFARWTAVLDGVGEGVIVADAEGRPVAMNDAALAIHKAPDSERAWRALISPEGVFEAVKLDGEVLPARDWPLLRALRGERFEQQVLRVECLKSGRRWIASYRSSPVFDDAGRLEFAVCVIRDITAEKTAEDALRASQQQAERQLVELETLYRTAPIGLVLYDCSLRYVRINELLAEINGLPVADHIGRSLEEVVPDLAQSLEPILRRVVETGEAVTDLDYRVVAARHPGVIGDWLLHFYPLKDADGSVRAVGGIVQDVTIEREAVAALRASQQRFKDVAEAASDWFWEHDAEGRFTFFSERLTELTGVSTTRWLGKRRSDLVVETAPPSDLKAHLAEIAARRPFRNFTYWVETPKGRRCFSISGKPFFNDDSRFLGYRGAGSDVTEAKRTEETLQESQQRLRAALDASGTGTFIWNLATRQVRIDAKLNQLFGLPERPTLRHIDELLAQIHPEDRPAMLERIERASAELGQVESQYRVIWPDGSVHWITDRGRTLLDEGGAPQWRAGACLDITERKRSEEHLQRLMAELDHRVKNALTVVQSIASRTLRRDLSPEDFVAAFKGRLKALADIHHLLASVNWGACDFRAVIELALKSHGDRLGDRITLSGPKIMLQPEPCLALKLILHEMATNAAKHGSLSVPDGRLRVTWESFASSAADGGRTLRIHWTESDGPSVEPPRRRGYGSELIENGIAYQLGGTARLEHRSEGLICELSIPYQPPNQGQL